MSDIQVSDTAGVAAFLEDLQQPLSLLELPNIAPGEPAAARLLAFCQLLLKWNASLNLTGARNLADLVQDHLADAFVLGAKVPLGAQVVDVGSGGGLPALPLAVLRPDLKMTLVEPRTKRVAFLRTAIRELGLNAVVHAGKVEDWSGSPDVAVSRATFAPEVWVSMALGLVRPHGVAYALLNDHWNQATIPQHQPTGVHTYRLVRGQTRTLAWFAKG